MSERTNKQSVTTAITTVKAQTSSSLGTGIGINHEQASVLVAHVLAQVVVNIDRVA